MPPTFMSKFLHRILQLYNCGLLCFSVLRFCCPYVNREQDLDEVNSKNCNPVREMQNSPTAISIYLLDQITGSWEESAKN